MGTARKVARDTFTDEDATEQLKSLNIDDLQLVDDFDPLYEFLDEK